MKRTDMRSLDSGARAERRRRVVSLRKRGRTYAQIAEECELSVTGVFNICRRYEAEGTAGLIGKTPGRREGAQRTLTATQEAAIRKLICDKTPDQLRCRLRCGIAQR